MKLKARHVTFTLIALASLYVLYHNERFLIDSEHPAWQRYESFKWWLLPHGIFGTIVLVFAPFQFSERIRQRFIKAHRVMGRFYVVGALALAPMGAYIQYYQERMGGPRSFSVLGVVDAVLLSGTTLMAFYFAFRRNIPAHKQWATRSYAVALVFIAARFFLGVTGWERLGVEIVQAVIWSCMVMAVPLADVAINWNQIKAAKRVQPRVPQSVPEPVRRAA